MKTRRRCAPPFSCYPQKTAGECSNTPQAGRRLTCCSASPNCVPETASAPSPFYLAFCSACQMSIRVKFSIFTAHVPIRGVIFRLFFKFLYSCIRGRDFSVYLILRIFGSRVRGTDLSVYNFRVFVLTYPGSAKINGKYRVK